jgi:hypothetical protein
VYERERERETMEEPELFIIKNKNGNGKVSSMADKKANFVGNLSGKWTNKIIFR